MPGDSSRALFIPDRWRSRFHPLISGHVNSPSQKGHELNHLVCIFPPTWKTYWDVLLVLRINGLFHPSSNVPFFWGNGFCRLILRCFQNDGNERNSSGWKSPTFLLDHDQLLPSQSLTAKAPEKWPKPNRKGSSSFPFRGELLNFKGVFFEKWLKTRSNQSNYYTPEDY